MENNIYYQLAKTECTLDRCKARLFKKNLTILGLIGMVYILGKAGVYEYIKYKDIRKERDELAEKYDSAMDELNRMKKTEENKSVHCDGHATLSNT